MKSLPRSNRWANRETKLVCDDLRKAACPVQQRKALRVAQRKTAAELAAWLAKDFQGMYGECRSPECSETLLQMAATRLVLGRVDWQQVAREVLAMAGRGRKTRALKVGPMLTRLAETLAAAG